MAGFSLETARRVEIFVVAELTVSRLLCSRDGEGIEASAGPSSGIGERWVGSWEGRVTREVTVPDL